MRVGGGTTWLTYVALLATVGCAQESTESAEPRPAAHIHPLFAEDYACQEHPDGQLPYKGDALGTDCFITRLVETGPNEAFSRAFENDGSRNEDWFGWRAEVLAPFDGVVRRVSINPVTNSPGRLGSPPASMMVFQRDDGTSVLYAHIREPTVEEGDRVTAGQPVARVGNNGFGRNPHIHIGAWLDDEPLQLRHDLVAMAKLRGTP